MKSKLWLGAAAVAAHFCVWQAFASDAPTRIAAAVTGESAVSSEPAGHVARGRYLVQVAGCNDCHTPGYAGQAGKVPEQDWLTGDALGWTGPWGTTYPINLRLFVADLTAGQWLTVTRNAVARPPMPWFNLHAMSDEDLLAIYHYVRALGPTGQPAPAYLPPGVAAATPVVRFPGIE